MKVASYTDALWASQVGGGKLCQEGDTDPDGFNLSMNDIKRGKMILEESSLLRRCSLGWAHHLVEEDCVASPKSI